MRIVIAVVLVCCLLACRKEIFTTDAARRLTVAVDTVRFDTVFTSTGSASQAFKIFNGNKEGIRVSNVRLAGGAASPFKINVDGTPGPVVANLEIKGNDSAYVFVTVRIDPTTSNLPFIVQDSVLMDYNGNTLKVHLQAYGQNARFLRNAVITGTQTWNNELPYVILGSLQVAEGAQLTITEGTNVYMHADAPFVVGGTLQVQGKKWDSTRVLFTGDRLDAPYRNFPGSWPGLIFTASSSNNNLAYAVIKNAYQAVVAAGPANGASPKLTLLQCVIDNAFDAGILASNASITAQNLLLANCGKNLVLVNGGTYNFTHCTIAAYSNSYIQHKEPLVFISNFAPDNTAAAQPLTASFTNCIFWAESGGLVPQEVVLAKNGTQPYAVTFNNVLWPLAAPPANATVTGTVLTGPPEFETVDNGQRFYDFRLKETAPALNKGAATAVSLDLDGNPRPVGLPDLGAYEKQ